MAELTHGNRGQVRIGALTGIQLVLTCAAALCMTDCNCNSRSDADGNAYDCTITCDYDSLHPGDPLSEGDLQWDLDALQTFLTEVGLEDMVTPCVTGFDDVCFPGERLSSDTAAEESCSNLAETMAALLNGEGGTQYSCSDSCSMSASGVPVSVANLLDLDNVGGTGEARSCYSAETPEDVSLECSIRRAIWRADNGGSGCLGLFLATASCVIPPDGNSWNCTGTPTFVDQVPDSDLDCVVEESGVAAACDGSPIRDTDRKFALDTTASFVNVFQPDETTPEGATCPRALVGSTSLGGDLWLDGGLCPGEMCPVTIGDFDWATTSTLDMGAICGGPDLGDVTQALLRAVDAIDLLAVPDGPGTNLVTIGPGDLVASLTFANGGSVQGLEIENAVAETVVLDATTERIVVDLTFLQNLILTTREFEVHLEAMVVNHRPVADAGPDQAADCGDVVTLTSFSTDPEGPSDLATFAWAAIDPATGALLPRGSGPSITGRLVETTEFVLTVMDASGATDEDSVVVTLPPFDPVAIDSVTVTPECLWPPNHSYVPYRLGTDLVVTASGGVCGPRGPFVRITGVTSDEPDDGRGDGHTTDDAVFSRGALCVRSERSGGGDGRGYTVTVEARDVAGNVAVTTVPITVPHDQDGTEGCDAEPTFVDDDDPRCAFGRRSSAATTAGCAASVMGEGTGGNVAGTAALSLLVILFAWVRRRRR